jgi:predicted membrane protein
MKGHGGSLKWGIILIIIGLVFLLHNYGIMDFWWIIGRFWPLLLIWWGYTMIRDSRKAHGSERARQLFGDQRISVDSREINNSTVFGDIRLTVSSPEFIGGRAKVVFGDIHIDLAGVGTIASPGFLELESVFGDMAIRVPEHVAVEVRATRAFGTVTTPDGSKFHGDRYKSPDFDTASSRLELSISQVFGDLEIMKAEVAGS